SLGLEPLVPTDVGSGYTLGEKLGEQAHTLSIAELSAHTHVVNASSAAASAVIPNNTTVLAPGQFEIYRAPSSLGAMKVGSVANVGGSPPHLNMQPFLVLTCGIALQGTSPSPN